MSFILSHVMNDAAAHLQGACPEDLQAGGAYDLRPQVEELAQEILQRLESHKDNNTNDPLFVLLGENHTIPAQKAFQLLLLKKLQEAGISIGVGLERPYNRVQVSYKEYHKRNSGPVPPIEKITGDDHGALSLKSDLACYRFEWGRIVSIAFFNFLLKNQLSVSFNDAARSSTGHKYDIDLTDPIATQCMGGSPAFDDASGVSRSGLFLRNKILMAHMMRDASLKKPDIYIQQCGATHLFGQRNVIAERNRPYFESLSYLLREENQNICAVSLLSKGLCDEPADYDFPENNRIDVVGLGGTGYACSIDPEEFETGEVTYDYDEMRDLVKFLKASGVYDSIYAGDLDMKALYDEMAVLFERWLDYDLVEPLSHSNKGVFINYKSAGMLSVRDQSLLCGRDHILKSQGRVLQGRRNEI